MSGGTYLQELSKNTEKRTKALKKKEPQSWKVLLGRCWTIIQPINVLTVNANLEQEHIYESQRRG